jgi:hypothetical protein
MTQRGYHFAVPIDDETAWSYFNEWDSADEARRSVLAESLGRYADEKEFEERSNQETFIQNLFTDEEYLGQVSELSSFKDVETGITIFPEDQEKRAAVQTFLSFTLNRPLSGFEYEFQRDAFARTHFGKNAVSDPEIFSLIQDDFETKERQEQGLTDLLSITVRQVLEDRILGRPTESGSSYMHWLASLERQDVAFEKESKYLNSAFELEQTILSDIEPFVDDIAHGYDIVARHLEGESDTKEEQEYLAALSEKPKEHQIAVLSYLYHSGLTEFAENANVRANNKSTPARFAPDSAQQSEDNEDLSTEEAYSEESNQRRFDKDYPILSPILQAIKGITGYLLGPFRPDNDDLALTTTEIRQRQRQSLKNIGSLSTESFNPTTSVVTNNGDGTMSPNWEGIGGLGTGVFLGRIAIERPSTRSKTKFLKIHQSKAPQFPSTSKQHLQNTKTVQDAARITVNEPAYEGTLYSPQKLQQLRNYLERRKVQMMATTGNPAFLARIDGTGTMFLPANPTVLQVKHELSHYIDFRNLGFEGYIDLGRAGREMSVLNRLKRNRCWEQMNATERAFSIKYATELK